VLTQFQSHSLNSHLAASYPPIRLPGPNGAAWVDVLAAQQTNSSREWYKGSADAIRKNIFELKDEARGVDPATDYVILSGAAIYNLDVGKLLAYHRARGADITMCTHLVDENVAPTKGIVKVHQSSGRILKFEEKPSSSRLTSLQREAMEAHGINGVNGTTTPKRKQGGSQYLANMGIYVFRRDALFELLSDAKASAITHIGHHIIPTALAQGLRVHGFQHNGYWQDVSTLRDYYEANLALAGLESPIKMFDVDGAVMGSPRGRLLPPTVMQGEVSVNNSLLDDGTVLVDCSVDNCVVGQCLYIGRGSIAENSLLLGSPYWTSDTIRSEAIARGERVYGVGENCVLRNCILDENVTINDGVQIINAQGVKEADRSDTEGYMIQDGIVVIMRNAVIPAGTVI
jgi:glucose-1-phosphate adenylyltransferase